MFPLPFQIGSIGPIWATFETKPENVSTVFDVNLLIRSLNGPKSFDLDTFRLVSEPQLE